MTLSSSRISDALTHSILRANRIAIEASMPAASDQRPRPVPVALGGGGRLGEGEMVLAALLAPGLVLGFLLSSHIRHLLDAGHTRIAVLLVSGAAGAAVILRELAA